MPEADAWPKLFHAINMDGAARSPEDINSHIDLNPEDKLSKEREIAFVSIGREVFLGQAMFVVDIDVRSIRLKKVPFFDAPVDRKSLK
jgi:hypothetical protein